MRENARLYARGIAASVRAYIIYACVGVLFILRARYVRIRARSRALRVCSRIGVRVYGRIARIGTHPPLCVGARENGGVTPPFRAQKKV